MATRKIEVRYCDGCGNDAPNATKWTIRTVEGQFAVDLCKSCVETKPLADIRRGVNQKSRRRNTKKVYGSREEALAAGA